MMRVRDSEPAPPERVDPLAVSFKPMRYGLITRYFDMRNGRQDGRKGLPDVSAEPVTTPTFEVLAALFVETAEKERLRVDLATAALHGRQGELRARIAIVGAAADEQRRGVEALGPEPSEQECLRRVGGETRTDPAVVATRRRRDHGKRLAAACAELARTLAELGEYRTQLARVVATISAEEAAGATQVRRMHAYVLRRLATYQRSLVRKHPEGTTLNSKLAARAPQLPVWVVNTTAEPLRPDAPANPPEVTL
jgi:hypothetical protein